MNRNEFLEKLLLSKIIIDSDAVFPYSMDINLAAKAICGGDIIFYHFNGEVLAFFVRKKLPFNPAKGRFAGNNLDYFIYRNGDESHIYPCMASSDNSFLRKYMESFGARRVYANELSETREDRRVFNYNLEGCTDTYFYYRVKFKPRDSVIEKIKLGGRIYIRNFLMQASFRRISDDNQ